GRNGGVATRGRAVPCVPGAAEPPCAATDPGVPPPPMPNGRSDRRAWRTPAAPLNKIAADAPPATTTPDRPRTARPRMTALSRTTRMGGTPDWASFRNASRLTEPAAGLPSVGDDERLARPALGDHRSRTPHDGISG